MVSDSKRFDVAILGTGMAGTILGSILAKRGVSVVLIDSRTHPRFTIGESTIPHTSLLLSILAQRYGVAELDHLAYPDRIAQHICTSCGIKRSFGFAYQREGKAYDNREGLQFGTSSKDENHLFRQDIDAYLVNVAARYGASVRLKTEVTSIDIDSQGVTLETTGRDRYRARFLVDATGYNSLLANRFSLRENPTSLVHQSRSLFTHMIDVGRFGEADHPLTIPWHQCTLHHVFDGGWFWVIPFNNNERSTNQLVSVGLTVDPRRFPKDGTPAEEEFRTFLRRFPSVAEQFVEAKAVRPWTSTGRLQYSSKSTVGYRYCLMSHAAGFVDPLFSRGLINTLEVISGLVEPLLTALDANDFDVDRFAHLEVLHRRLYAYNDRLVRCSYASWSNFDLWNAWLRVWALGTIIAEFRVMNALTDYTATGDPACLESESASPVFSDFEDPDYAAFFSRAVAEVDDFTADARSASESAARIFELAAEYEFPVPLRLDAMRRARWMAEDDEMSERNLLTARRGYRWALTNPSTRDLFGSATTFYRWRSQQSDPHLVNDSASTPPRSSGGIAAAE